MMAENMKTAPFDLEKAIKECDAANEKLCEIFENVNKLIKGE